MAAISSTDICNLALGQLGGGSGDTRRISSLNDTTDTAHWCNLYWPRARRETLSRWRWVEATERLLAPAELEVDTDGLGLSGGWTYQYDLPNGLLRLVSVYDESHRNITYRFERRKQKIYTNIDGVYVEYIADNDSTTEWSEGLINAVAMRLAFWLAVPILGRSAGMQARRDMHSLWMQALNDGQAMNQNEVDDTEYEGDKFWHDEARNEWGYDD